MRLEDKETRLRDELAELEGRAGSVLAGADAELLTEETLSRFDRGELRREADAVLNSIGAPPCAAPAPALSVVTNPALTLEAKRAIVTERLTSSANLVLIAARNFEGLPDETVNTLYDQLVELDKRAVSRK